MSVDFITSQTQYESIQQIVNDLWNIPESKRTRADIDQLEEYSQALLNWKNKQNQGENNAANNDG